MRVSCFHSSLGALGLALDFFFSYIGANNEEYYVLERSANCFLPAWSEVLKLVHP